jgi:hypothetical protein
MQCADRSFRLNPDAIQRMSQMSRGGRQHLRKVARKRDTSQTHARFHLSQAEADIAEAKEQREAADKTKEKATQRRISLENFKPTLDLKCLQETGPSGFTVKQIREQISWHRKIEQDIHIPVGVHKMKKAEVWVVMIRAVRRHLHEMSTNEGD